MKRTDELVSSFNRSWKRFSGTLKKARTDASEKSVHDLRVNTRRIIATLELASNERVKALLENALCGRRSDRDIDDRFQFGLMHDFQRAAGDVDAVVSDTLDIGNNLHRGCDETKIGRNRLLAGEDLEADVINLDFESIDLVIFINHTLGQRWPPLHKSPRGVSYGCLRFVADQQELLFQ